MSTAWLAKQDEEREEEELDDTDYKSQKDAVLFAIEVSESMLAPPPPSESMKAEKDSALSAALKCAYQIMQQRIISSPKDMMGVLLYGTEQTKFQDEDTNSGGGLPYPHCYLYIDLDVPAASDVKALKTAVEDDEEAQSLLVPTKEAVNMSNVLFCANQIFTTKAPNFGSRRLFIITDQDDPHASDKALRSAAAVRAKDLYDLGVIIELFPISKLDHDFDRSKFYDDIIYHDPTDPDAPVLSSTAIRRSVGGDGISLLNALISNVNSKQVAKRALFANMPFEIGPGFKISVKGYNILQPQKPTRQSYIWLNGEKAQIAVGESTQMAEDSTRTVEKAEIKKAYRFGGDQVIFSKEEQKELKKFGPAGIRIIGFKPMSLLPLWASIDKSTFIYPSEEDYVGSTRVFTALWQKLLKDEKMGLAWYIARVNAKPEIVALLPSQERLDDAANQQIIPAGLWLYQLPFVDDIRYPPELPPLVSPDVLIDKMRVVIQQLQLPGARYEPAKYPNPALQWQYRILQAIALEEEIPEFRHGDDKTVPKYKQIDKRAGAYVVEWGTLLKEQCKILAPGKSSSLSGNGIKREADDARGGASKKAKPEASHSRSSGRDSLDGMTVDQLKKQIQAGNLAKATVGELREFLTNRGLDPKGIKAVLMDRIEQWLDGQ